MITDLIGKKFQRLIVVGVNKKKNRNYLIVRCDCGQQTEVTSYSLTIRKTISCGCYRAEQLSIKNTVHAMSSTRTYRIWKAMRTRCNNKNTKVFYRYGGAGIFVCKSWDVFDQFLKDMGEAPDGCSIDRIDGAKGYSKTNCRWATPLEQSRNTERTHKILFNNKIYYVSDLAIKLGLSKKTIIRHYKNGKLLRRIGALA